LWLQARQSRLTLARDSSLYSIGVKVPKRQSAKKTKPPIMAKEIPMVNTRVELATLALLAPRSNQLS
jgi:hypothetical protein